MPIRQYLDGERFDPETTRLLGIAFEFAIQALHNWGVIDPQRETIARAIIGFARAGERDPERLCDLAVEACSKSIVSDPSPSSASRRTAGAARLNPGVSTERRSLRLILRRVWQRTFMVEHLAKIAAVVPARRRLGNGRNARPRPSEDCQRLTAISAARNQFWPSLQGPLSR